MAAQTQEQWEARTQAETANPRTCPTCGRPPSTTYKYARQWIHYCRHCKHAYNMTPLPKRPRGQECAEPGCERITEGSTGRCRDHYHTVPSKRPNRARNRRYGRHHLSRQQLAEIKANGCLWCGTTERVQVDHIEEYWYAPELERDLTNMQALCWTCHKDKTNAVREATWELARLNPLHFQALMQTEVAKARALAQARDTKAH